MPGNVPNAVATTVLPASLCSSFTEEREYRVRVNEYPDGSSQQLNETTLSRKRFTCTRKLASAQWETLKDFYNARRGPLEVFYFYFGIESSPLFFHDPTGVDATGRYTVRFEGEFSVELGLGRVPASLVLVEVA